MSLAKCNETIVAEGINKVQPVLKLGVSMGQVCTNDPEGKNDACSGDSGKFILDISEIRSFLVENIEKVINFILQFRWAIAALWLFNWFIHSRGSFIVFSNMCFDIAKHIDSGGILPWLDCISRVAVALAFNLG